MKGCPLCTEYGSTVLETISFEKIWKSLANDLGACIDQEVISRHTPNQEVSLLECLTCGLQYFRPAIPGDSDFYIQLSGSVLSPYYREKWDFQVAMEFITPGLELLDIGCGEGAWLKRALAVGCKVCGIDTNPAAIEKVRDSDIPAYCINLEDFARDNMSRFDIVTAFHIIEHLPLVKPFINEAKNCLKAGGKLILTVPNRLRRLSAAFEPLDYPPHHITRWSARQFYVLAELTALKLIAVRYEPLSMGSCRAVLRKRIAPAGQSEKLWARAIGWITFNPLLYGLYEHLGLLHRWRLWGHSMMAVFEK